MEQQFSLYIDHQQIAPLVRELEKAVQACRSAQEEEYESSEIRMTLYQEFLQRLHTLYLELHPQIKVENGVIKLEGLAEGQDPLQHYPQIEDLPHVNNPQTSPKKPKSVSAKNLEVEVQLMQWIQACDKRIFQKREIDQKYQELIDDPKKVMTLKKIKELVERFKLTSMIVRTRNKQEHFFGVDPNVSVSTLIKKEEGTLNHSFWQDEDEKTIKDSREFSTSVKEENQSLSQSPSQRSQQEALPPLSTKNEVMAEQSQESVKLDI